MPIRKLAAGAVAGLMLLVAPAASALFVNLAVTPGSPQPADIDDEVFIEIEILFGLGDDAAPSVGAYELDASYDISKLSFLSATFGDPACALPGVGDTCLGELADAEVLLAGPDDDLAGTVELGAVSLLSPQALTVGEPDPVANVGQPGSFIVATLKFIVTGQGPTTVNLTQALFVDENGDPLNTTVSPAYVQIVPEPGTALLLLGGLVALGARRDREGREA